MCVRASTAWFPTGVHPSEQSLVFNQESLLAMPYLCFLCELGVNSVYEKRKLILQPLLQWGINSLPFLPGHLISWKLLEQNLFETFKTLSNLVENGQAFQKLQVRRNSSQLCEHINFFCLENWDKNRLWNLSPAIGYQSIKATTEK